MFAKVAAASSTRPRDDGGRPFRSSSPSSSSSSFTSSRWCSSSFVPSSSVLSQYAGGSRRRKNGIDIVHTTTSPPPLSRASSNSSEPSSERELALLPEDSADALYRYRKVMSVLFALGGSLHAPDVFGNGPLSSLNDVHAFGDLPRLAQCVTLLWAIGGPAAALAASKNLPVADVMIGCIASCEILVGVGFKTGHGVDIPEPIVMAQVVNVASAIGLRLWEKNEKKEKEGEEEGES